MLCERYIFGANEGELWTPSRELGSSVGVHASDASGGDDTRFLNRCLRLLESWLAADPTGCDLLVQHVLAPPLPDLDASFDLASSASARSIIT